MLVLFLILFAAIHWAASKGRAKDKLNRAEDVINTSVKLSANYKLSKKNALKERIIATLLVAILFILWWVTKI